LARTKAQGRLMLFWVVCVCPMGVLYMGSGIWALYTPKLPIWPLIGLPDLAGDRARCKMGLHFHSRARSGSGVWRLRLHYPHGLDSDSDVQYKHQVDLFTMQTTTTRRGKSVEDGQDRWLNLIFRTYCYCILQLQRSSKQQNKSDGDVDATGN
jgi:hypothetical protein